MDGRSYGTTSRCCRRVDEAEQGGLPGGTTPHRLTLFHSSVTICPSAAWTDTVLTCEDTEQPAQVSAALKAKAAIRVDETFMSDPLMGRLILSAGVASSRHLLRR
jgi:hypothetical protein